FSAHVLTLDLCTSAPSMAYCNEVSDDATCGLCTLGFCGRAVPVTRIALPRTSCAATSTRGLSTNRSSPATAPDRSPVLGVALMPLDRLASSPHLCPTSHDPYLATAALSRPLERLEPTMHARLSGDGQGGMSANPRHVAGEPDVGRAQDRGRTEEAGH